VLLPERLASHPFKPSEACFCLLDQRTFECDWATVASVARHKADGMKIEIFYFLAQGWLNRAVSGLGDPEARMTKWWGRDDWGSLIQSNQWRRTDILCDRFRTELGYAFCCAFPIYSRDAGGRLMFSMIHASDHPEAPKLMVRAYNNAIAPLEPMEQLELEFQKPAD
jgi:three-Cys-motif partner protein